MFKNLIKVTLIDADSKKMYINVLKIESFTDSDDKTIITMDSGVVHRISESSDWLLAAIIDHTEE
jgi:hypothetical protein